MFKNHTDAVVLLVVLLVVLDDVFVDLVVLKDVFDVHLLLVVVGFTGGHGQVLS